jgi:hypothetical protein
VGETLDKDLFAMPQAFFGETQLLPNLIEVLTTKVFEFASLEQIPNTFLWIKPANHQVSPKPIARNQRRNSSGSFLISLFLLLVNVTTY